ncbi:DUF3626 domain-containing protein [Streptomyces sp. NPDC056517]|uniref:DUF3626 domain-containing protein n=1 Tax=Streptomyces sp. NPDC056517 TaxID=3345848 RepID=UPI00369DB347
MGLIALAEGDDKDLLDDCIEAQIHGPVHIARDVEALVLDPSHRGTEVEGLAPPGPLRRAGRLTDRRTPRCPSLRT